MKLTLACMVSFFMRLRSEMVSDIFGWYKLKVELSGVQYCVQVYRLAVRGCCSEYT